MQNTQEWIFVNLHVIRNWHLCFVSKFIFKHGEQYCQTFVVAELKKKIANLKFRLASNIITWE